jgi:hypothetical protein
MENERPGVSLWVCNQVEVAKCCPVSRNPKPGSVLSIQYRSGKRTLEVYSLHRYIQSFVGGHPDGTRNMETMIQKVAQDCADALGVPVRVSAELILAPQQRMRVVCRAEADDLLSGDAPAGVAGADGGAAVRQPAAVDREEVAASGDL